MENKKKIKLFMIGSLLITLILGGLVFVNTAFVPACYGYHYLYLVFVII